MTRRRINGLVTGVVLAASVLVAPPVAANHSEAALLPDLGMAPLTDFRIERRPRGDHWLRFSAVIVNVGAGPFEAHRYTNASGQVVVEQRIWDGSGWTTHPADAVMYWSGDGHNHWHVRDLQQYELVSQNGLERMSSENRTTVMA